MLEERGKGTSGDESGSDSNRALAADMATSLSK